MSGVRGGGVLRRIGGNECEGGKEEGGVLVWRNASTVTLLLKVETHFKSEFQAE